MAGRQPFGINPQPMIDNFLREHEVDVGRFLAAGSFIGALSRLFDVVGALLDGRIDLDFGVLIGVIVGIGLWQHRAWARMLVLVITWLAAGFCAVLVVLVIVGTRMNVTLTFGSTVLRQPTPLQGMVFGCMAFPLATLVLVVLNSGKVREEFRQRAAIL